jgi:hypothetical protein
MFHVCSASDEICSTYAQHIFNDDSPRSFFTFPSLPPIIHSSVSFSPPCLKSFVPSLKSLYFVSHLVSPTPVLRLCSLYPVLCPLSHVLLLVSCPLYSHRLSHVICFLSPILLSPSPNPYQLSQGPLFCGFIPLFLTFIPLFPVPCAFVSCLLFLRLLSPVPSSLVPCSFVSCPLYLRLLSPVPSSLVPCAFVSCPLFLRLLSPVPLSLVPCSLVSCTLFLVCHTSEKASFS